MQCYLPNKWKTDVYLWPFWACMYLYEHTQKMFYFREGRELTSSMGSENEVAQVSLMSMQIVSHSCGFFSTVAR